MPLPTSRPSAQSEHRIIQLQPEMKVQELIAVRKDDFVAVELVHWLSDLEKRKQEGDHYLDWLVWLESGSHEGKHSAPLSRLLQGALPALQKLIQKHLDTPGEAKTKATQSIQQQYFRFCDHYDQVKLSILEEMDWRRGLLIY